MFNRTWPLSGLLLVFAAACSLDSSGPTAGERPLLYLTPAAVADLVVDDDGLAVPGNCDAATATHATISAAVAAAVAGQTIQVCPGLYAEGVSLTKSLALVGPNVGTSGLGARAPEAMITTTATTVLIDAEDVTVDGFQIAGDFPVYVQGSASGLTLANNVVTGTSRAVSLDASGDGIKVLGNSLTSPVRSLHVSAANKQNVAINGNRFSGAAGTGIFFSGLFSIAGFEFQSNEVNHLANLAARISNGMVSGNTVNARFIIDVHSSTISGNTFNGGAVRPCLQLFGVQFGEDPSTNVMIANNQFNDCGSAGTGSYALQLSEGVDQITITKNTFTNSYDGISTRMRFVGDAPGPEPPPANWTLNANIHINRNAFLASRNHGINNTVLGTLDGECNWWGTAAGPAGTNDASGNVDYTPWLTGSNLDTAPCNGPLPPVATSKDQCKKDGWMNVARADGSRFKNQGDCIQYVNTGK